jgi:hypothetical protein
MPRFEKAEVSGKNLTITVGSGKSSNVYELDSETTITMPKLQAQRLASKIQQALHPKLFM